MVMGTGIRDLRGTTSGLTYEHPFHDQTSINNLKSVGPPPPMLENERFIDLQNVPQTSTLSGPTSSILTTSANASSSVTASTELDPAEDAELFSDIVLSYISQMLMEEDVDEKFEHPALLAAEKPFYDILAENSSLSPDQPPLSSNHSSGSPDDSSNNHYGSSSGYVSKNLVVDNNSWPYDSLEYQQLQTHPAPVDYFSQSSFSSSNIVEGLDETLANTVAVPDLFSESQPAWEQFRRGVEEARKFLPSEDKLVIDLEANGFSLPREEVKQENKLVEVKAEKEERQGSRGRKNPHGDDWELEEGRSNKQSAVFPDQTVRTDMFDRILLYTGEACLKGPSELRAAMEKEASRRSQSNQSKGSGGGKGRGKRQPKREVVDLRTILIHCAQAVAIDDRRNANELLKQIRQHSSPYGDATQRLAHYFADGLQARLAGTGAGLRPLSASLSYLVCFRPPAMAATAETKGPSTLRNAFGGVLGVFILLLIGVLAFSIRLFSVIKYESVIHEFDPYFNYRVTQYLTKNGIYDFWNWFDDRTWYPLGRVIGGTVYPGLTLTAGSMWWLLNSLNIPLSVETVCVFTAPIFSANAAWATFLLTKEVKGTGAGLTAAVLLAMVPSYISRSVAGSYDNEAVAIFALVFTFYLYIKTLNTGSLFYATLNALSYFYMVCSWGGYTFIINLIPMHVLLCILTGRYSSRLYIAYAPLVVLGTLLASLVPVVGFNAVMTSEHFASFLVFIIIHVVAFIYYIKGILSPKMFKVAMTLVVTIGLAVSCAVIAIFIALVASSPTKGWSGRSLSLLDPTYASKYIPIIASVSEHQPPTWPSYFMDINVLAFLVPAGIIACFLPLSDASSFVVLYLVTSVYFSGVMVRLMLVLAPAACIMSGIALSEAFDVFTRSIKLQLPNILDNPPDAGDMNSVSSIAQNDASKIDSHAATKSETVSKERPSRKNRKKEKEKEKENVEKVPSHSENKKRLLVLPLEASAVAILLLIVLGGFYVVHCVWAAAEAYSAPSIVLTSYAHDGLHVFDDFREAYAWLRHNTDVDDKVASWWDYGYQTTAMANRTVIVDNNTWNNTHIATVGTAMSSPEKAAWEIFNSLDVKYVLVVFGGLVGYPSDDINKFLWMVRIGGGVFPHIREPDYLRDGQYRIDAQATPTMLNCLMYKLSYYRFVETDGKAFDRVRRTEIGKKYFKLTHFEEVFTTHHWMVRIYKLKPPKNRIRGKLKKPKSSSKSSSSNHKRAGNTQKNPWQ